MNQAIKALFEMRTRDQGSLVPRPRPAFRRLQYGKAGSALFHTANDGKLGGAWERG